MIRVAHISSAKAWRGAEQQVHLLLNNDSPLIENYLFCPDDAALPEKNVQLKHRTGTYKKIFGWDLMGGWKLKKFLQLHQVDLVDVHDSHALNLFWIARWLGANVPGVYHKHHDHPVKNVKKYNDPAIRKIICVSEAVYKTAGLRVEQNKLVVIYPGLKPGPAPPVSAFLKEAFQIPAKAKLAGMVCALEKEKNVSELVRIAETCNTGAADDLYFLLVGDGSRETEIRAEIKNAGLENRFFLTGFRDDIPAILAQLDIFIFTSVSEGFPLALLEAMQAGVPVVSRDSGGMKEMVLDNETGLLYHSVPEAFEKIKMLLSNEEACKRLTHHAKNFVRQFSVENMIQKTHTLYQEICS